MNLIKHSRFIVAATAMAALLLCGQAQAQTLSSLVVPGSDGKLTYTLYTLQGDVIPDFSHCGYMGGGVALPDVAVAAVIWPESQSTDDAPRIQRAIDSLSLTTPGADGFRGAILLKAGLYRIGVPLRIQADGIVLRGEGNTRNGTLLLATVAQRYNVIEIGPRGRMRPQAVSQEYPLTDKYVPSGSRTIHIRRASRIFVPGDQVIVRRPSTQQWITTIGMDSIPPRPLPGETTYDSFARLRREGAATRMNGTVQWAPGSKDLYYERVVVAVDGDRITLDIPLTNAFQAEYGGGTVYKYEFSNRIARCGVENLYGMSIFNTAVMDSRRGDIGYYYSDEQHANNFIACGAVENAWVRDVSVEQFDCCVTTSLSTKFFTAQDLSAIEPISVITGGRRYAYSVSGQMNLFLRCDASHHRHPYVLGATVAGPNAFVEGTGSMSFASSEPHQRWATGCLFDNIRIDGPDGSLLAVNRGWYGSGHGWSGAQMLFWNCSAPVIMVMQPPTAQNFAIGIGGKIENQWSTDARQKTIRAINGVSRSQFENTDVPAVGNGWIEHPTTEVYPKSLYMKQLQDRVGNHAAAEAIAAKKEYR